MGKEKREPTLPQKPLPKETDTGTGNSYFGFVIGLLDRQTRELSKAARRLKRGD